MIINGLKETSEEACAVAAQYSRFERPLLTASVIPISFLLTPSRFRDTVILHANFPPHTKEIPMPTPAAPPTKIMIIRHAEKPPKKGGVPLDVQENGEPGNGKSLIVSGWQRAGALNAFFAPYK